jgi:hypothetical protein
VRRGATHKRTAEQRQLAAERHRSNKVVDDVTVPSATIGASPARHDAESSPCQWRGDHEIDTIFGDGKGQKATWTVKVGPTPSGIGIERKVSFKCWKSEREEGDAQPQEWLPDNRWTPERIIWPAWTMGTADGAPEGHNTALDSVHDSWRNSSDRIRDSAKWTATVIGVTLAALVGTSPLTGLLDRPFTQQGWLTALTGLVMLATAMFLVLQVLRPNNTSYVDVQTAPDLAVPASSDTPAHLRKGWRRVLPRNPLSYWKHTVETQQDLWLPSGVKCLTTLRQAMIVDELTLMALSCAVTHSRVTAKDIGTIREAQAVRVARLHEFRQAAARIVEIGEFYRLRRRSDWAIYLGGTLGIIGTILIIVAFAWPVLHQS